LKNPQLQTTAMTPQDVQAICQAQKESRRTLAREISISYTREICPPLVSDCRKIENLANLEARFRLDAEAANADQSSRRQSTGTQQHARSRLLDVPQMGPRGRQRRLTGLVSASSSLRCELSIGSRQSSVEPPTAETRLPASRASSVPGRSRNHEVGRHRELLHPDQASYSGSSDRREGVVPSTFSSPERPPAGAAEACRTTRQPTTSRRITLLSNNPWYGIVNHQAMLAQTSRAAPNNSLPSPITAQRGISSQNQGPIFQLPGSRRLTRANTLPVGQFHRF